MLLTSGLDQSLSLGDRKELVLNNVRNEIEKAENVDIALDIISQLIIISKLSGLAQAEAIYRTKKKFQVSNDYIYNRVGLHHVTVDRYLRIGKMMDDGYEHGIIPKKYKNAIGDRNIKDLIPIANALEQGYEITNEQWSDIAQAPDFSSVSKIVREDIKEQEPRSNALMLYVQRDGDIVAFKDGERKLVAYLVPDKGDKIIEQAQERIKRGAGMLEA